jgi:hypothetical protein
MVDVLLASGDALKALLAATRAPAAPVDTAELLADIAAWSRRRRAPRLPRPLAPAGRRRGAPRRRRCRGLPVARPKGRRRACWS